MARVLRFSESATAAITAAESPAGSPLPAPTPLHGDDAAPLTDDRQRVCDLVDQLQQLALIQVSPAAKAAETPAAVNGGSSLNFAAKLQMLTLNKPKMAKVIEGWVDLFLMMGCWFTPFADFNWW